MSHQAVLLFLACVVPSVVSTCTFPSELQATWLTNGNRNITFTANSVHDYLVPIYGANTLDCFQEYNGKYLVKSQNTFTLAGLTAYAYACFDFTRINSNLYYYYLASNVTSGYQTEFIEFSLIPSPTTICAMSASQYETARFYVLVKDGDGEAAKTTCPTDIVASWSYGIDSGSGNTCGVTSGLLDGCTTSQITLNYTVCATEVFYSASGLVYCLSSFSNGSTNYLMVYNSDSYVDNTNNYQMACLVYSVSGSTLYMTQYPNECESGQSPTSVSTPKGSLLTLTGSTECPTIPGPESIVLYVVLGVIGGLVFLFIVGLAFCIALSSKKKPLRGRLEPQKPLPPPQTPRLNAIENGFRRQPKEKEQTKSDWREDSPDQEEDVPINVMQLLRKDVITPGGRDSPASNVLLSVTTPSPYPDIDGKSLGGISQPSLADGSALKKHYHVIGGEPSIGGLEEEDEEEFIEGNSAFTTPRGPMTSRTITPRTPMMVMPVQAEGSDPYEGGGDSETEEGGMYDTDGQSTLVAARQGVGIHEPMCPPSRLPPIDEGPASHRSFTGSGNGHNNHKHSKNNGFSEHNPTIKEEDGLPGALSDLQHPNEPQYASPHHPSSNHDTSSRPSSRAETPTGRRSSLGLLYKMEGNVMVAIPDLFDQVETGSGIVGKTEGKDKKGTDIRGRKPDGVRLKPLVRSAGGRRGSGTPNSLKAAAALQDPKKKRSGKSRGLKHRESELSFADDDEFKPKARVKVTRVDIPELLPPGEVEARAPGENELLESPGRAAFHNAAFDMSEGRPPVDGGESTPRRVWLDPGRPTQSVWSRVSNLWKLGHAWPDKHT